MSNCNKLNNLLGIFPAVYIYSVVVVVDDFYYDLKFLASSQKTLSLS